MKIFSVIFVKIFMIFAFNSLTCLDLIFMCGEERDFNILNFNEFVNFHLTWEVPPLFLHVFFFFFFNLESFSPFPVGLQ